MLLLLLLLLLLLSHAALWSGSTPGWRSRGDLQAAAATTTQVRDRAESVRDPNETNECKPSLPALCDERYQITCFRIMR